VKGAAAVLEKLLGVFNLAPEAKGSGIDTDALTELCGKFGLNDAHGTEGMVLALVEKRNEARKRKDFAASDEIRNELKKAGILIEDRKDGSVGWRIAN